MKAVNIAVLLLIGAEAMKLNSNSHDDLDGHYPKNLDQETITALEISEQAGDEARQEQIKDKQQREEEQYRKLHPLSIEQQIISSPEQLRQLEASKEKVEQQEKDRIVRREDNLVKMKTTWKDFCITLDKQKFLDAFLMKGDLLKEGADVNDLTIRVNTTDVYTKQFQFPDIAKYDYSVSELNGLEAAEKNLNDNIDNENLLGAFIDQAKLTAKNLQTKYGELWSPPHLQSPGADSTLQLD